MTVLQTLTDEVQFFLVHAGFSYDPVNESKNAGAIRCASALAQAESLYLAAHRVADVGIAWEDDPEGWSDYQTDKRSGYHEGDAPECIEQAFIWHRNESGDVEYLASLCGIQDADSNYRRVVRAELAAECADQLRAIIAEA